MVQDRIVELMEINKDLTIRMLLDNENALSASCVVDLLKNHPELQVFFFKFN